MQTEIKNEDGMYTTKGGNVLTSQQMAETIIEAIAHCNNQIKTTNDARKKKRLQDKLRNVKLWLAQHDDVKRHMQ